MPIERAGLEDADVLGELARATYAEHFAHIWSAAGLADYLTQQFGLSALRESLSSEQTHWYVLHDAGDMVGYIKLVLDRPSPAGGGRGMEVEKIYVQGDATGHGHGAALLAFALELAARETEPCVWLDVLKTNLAGQRFYARHGFAIVGDTPFATDLGEFGFWVMRR